jgi:hypothetical protein
MTKHGMAWNEFSLAEESHVEYIACQAKADCFLNAARIIHRDFVSEETTVNSHYYSEVRKCL